jgi:site-specific DNA-methyltransferase (adenine-specific)
MAVRIEDAGFEIRDMIAWVYGSGFPKSLDVSKAIDKAAGVQGEYGTPKSAAHAGWIDRGRMRGEEGHEGYQRPWMADAEAVEKNARQYIGGTDAARQWKGWGTALKPALEPITVARKPLIGTVAENVQAHGTGAINVDGCRVGAEPPAPRNAPKKIIRGGKFHAAAEAEREMSHFNPTQGRWPANLIHDGSEEVTELLSDAARFFYCAKASKRDRGDGNRHPTVKPTDLMRYLCRLVTPPSGTILDPFTGSGSTGKAAMLEGFQFIGIEREAEYVEIAKARIEAVKK